MTMESWMKFERVTWKTTVEMNNQSISGKEPVSSISFLQDFKTVCDAVYIHKGASTGLIKHYVLGSGKALIKAGMAVPTKTSKSKGRLLPWRSEIVNYIQKISDGRPHRNSRCRYPKFK